MIKRFAVVSTIFLSTIFSSVCFAEWTKIGSSVSGTDYYIDLGRIKKTGGFVYFWTLSNYLEPDKFGDFSRVVYRKVDCNLFRSKKLNLSYYTLQNANGTPSAVDNKPDEDWSYPSPDTVEEGLLKVVCN